MLSCPLCHSKRIHQSKRKGIIEQVILAMILVRPYRCEKCDYRFFRRSLSGNHNTSRAATTL
jgi:predicted Zn-ribbon and HTH transcriptional regulator